jgi:hypothetical protein
VTRTDRQSDPQKSTKLPARAEALTSDSDTIQGGKQGVEQGGEKGTTPPPASQGRPPLASLAQSVPYGGNGTAPLGEASRLALATSGNPFRGSPREAHWLSLNTKLALAEKPINHEWSIDDSPLGGHHPITWQEFLVDYDDGIPVCRPSPYCDKHSDDATPCHGCKAQKELGKKWDSVLYEWKQDYDVWFREMKNCEYCRNSDGKYTNDEGLFWCEHPDDFHDSRDYHWKKSSESEDSNAGTRPDAWVAES